MLRFVCLLALLLIAETECHRGHRRRGSIYAVCEGKGHTTTCRCKAGFTGDGYDCTDIDECLSGETCNEPATCRNTIGSYTCVCPQGYFAAGSRCVPNCPLAVFRKVGCFSASTYPMSRMAELAKRHEHGHTHGHHKQKGDSLGYGELEFEVDVDTVLNDPHGRHNHNNGHGHKAAVSICECAAETITDLYSYFSIRSYTKCMMGRKYNSMLSTAASTVGRSTSCYKGDQVTVSCKDDDTTVCVGGSGVDYVYKLDFCLLKNGGCDHTCSFNGITMTTTCSCNSGYNLAGNKKTCVEINECKASDKGGCSDICENTPGSYKCSCPAGYVLIGNQRTCTDINECSANDKGGCSDTCENTPGSYKCSCPAGYVLLGNQRTCQDINECSASDTGGCSDTCENTPGSYKCSCPTGYALLGNQRTCQDIIECSASDKGGCSDTCENTPGSYKCSCPIGYVLLGNQRTCQDINECSASDKGGCSDTCENTPGSYKCICPTGYALLGNQRTCQDIDECLRVPKLCSQKCRNSDGSYSCYCDDGYKLDSDQKSCIDEDECKLANRGGCDQICINKEGRHECSCNEDYVLQSNGKSCTLREMKWPSGSYGILSHDPCPTGWYEFTHCMDTQDIGNIDSTKDFDLGFHTSSPSQDNTKCADSFVTFRYCFKGPTVPSRSGGFWTATAKFGEAYVIKNTLKNDKSDCEIFGGNGGSVEMDTEDIFNKDKYGNDGLNNKAYPLYQPNGFNFQNKGSVILQFCKIGETKENAAAKMIEVGNFPQKFGFFIDVNAACPTLKSPTGYLYGTRQRLLLDLEDSLNTNDVVKPAPFIMQGKGNFVAMVCQYDPTKGHANNYLWPAGTYGILSKQPCPPNWFEFNHCVDTEDLWNADNTKDFTLGLGNLCGKSSVSFRYCFKGANVPSRSSRVSADKGSVYVVNNILGGCGGGGGSVHMIGTSSSNRNTFGNTTAFNKKVYPDYYPNKFDIVSSTNTVDLSFCKIGSANQNYIEVGVFGQPFGFFVSKDDVCPETRTPYGVLSGKKEYIKMDLKGGTSTYGTTPVNLLSKGNIEEWVCAYDPQ